MIGFTFITKKKMIDVVHNIFVLLCCLNINRVRNSKWVSFRTKSHNDFSSGGSCGNAINFEKMFEHADSELP